jgi:hypothetical protein
MTQKRLSNKPFTLSVNETYNYTIVTGSYPQSFIYALNSTHQRNQGHRSGVYMKEKLVAAGSQVRRATGAHVIIPLFFSVSYWWEEFQAIRPHIQILSRIS